MLLLIDGYNLLYAAGVIGSDVGPAGLERSRRALLNFLAESLPEEVVARTTVVFDATEAPPGLPRRVEFRGLTVRFAAKYADADTLIEELIGEATAPRRLTVVSSDHRLQRAARRRRARAVDSDRWYAEVVRQRRARQQKTAPEPRKPPAPLPEGDVQYWLAEFGADLAQRIIEEEEQAAQAEAEDAPGPSASPERTEAPGQTENPGEGAGSDKPGDAAEIENPFPPGYGEDLFEDLPEVDDAYHPFPPGYAEDVEDEPD